SDEIETGLLSRVQPGVVRSVHARAKEDVLRMALSFYGGESALPRAHEMMFCSAATSWPQLDAFLARCQYVPGLYVMVHVQRLSYKLQHRLVEHLKSLGSSYRLVLVALCKSDDAAQVHLLREIPAKPASPFSELGLKRFVELLAPKLAVVVSENAGCGLSPRIGCLAQDMWTRQLVRQKLWEI
ncbi:E3 ubiquitin-protein ligase, partial [Durusdinium trenchii]